jgi:hypothetical protein
MQAAHPVHSLLAHLEEQRLELVRSVAATGVPSPGSLERLATIQLAAMAVREEIKSHSPKPGFGGEKGLD